MPINNKKIKRELLRIVDQMLSWIMSTYEPYKRWKHNRNREQSLNICINPVHSRTNKVAVFLVFQPQGLMASTFLTLEHLKIKGYSTLLVSNSALMPQDITRALPLCWQIMQRPNFGYDFGGYQDGILHVMKSNQDIQQMLVINDSVWFPLHIKCDLLDRMEAKETGFVGAFQLEPTRNQNEMHGKKRPFMGSFFWHFKKPALWSEPFKSFWIKYKATSSKYATIRRGERGFTHHLLDSGIVGEALYSRLQFDRWIKETHGLNLHQALDELCITDPKLSNQRAELFAREIIDDTDWKTEAQSLAWSITKSQNIMATAPLFMVKNLKLPFLKKSSDEANLLALKKLNSYFTDNPELIDQRVLDEIRLVVQHNKNR